MKFETALRHLRNRDAVARRAGWTMRLTLRRYDDGRPFAIDRVAASGWIGAWTPTVADLLADDWLTEWEVMK